MFSHPYPIPYVSNGFSGPEKGMVVKLATVAAITSGLVYWLMPKNGRKHTAGAEDRYQTSGKHRMVKP